MTSTDLDAPGLSLGPIGLGGATFGREIDQAASFAMMDHARTLGVTMFDTAAAYSMGASERIVGAWLAARRPDPGTLTVATKIYPPFTPENIDAAVAASAERIGVEQIDLLYLHVWDATIETPEALQALDLLLRSDRVRMLGASNFTAARLRRCLALQASLGLTPFRALQNNHNLAVRGFDAVTRALCADQDIAAISYSPLGAGFLTGKHRDGVQPGSRFEIVPGHQDVYFNDASWRRLEKLSEVSQRIGHPMALVALAWALHQPGIAGVLVGGRTPAHLDQAFAALAFDDPALFAELECCC